MDKQPQMIDMTPTWGSLLPLMLDTLTNPSASNQSKQIMREELARMAQGADSFNVLQKKLKQDKKDLDPA